MEIKFDVYFKKNLGTLCKDNEVDLDGKEAYVNLDLSLVDRLEVNYSVGGTKYTDEVTIKDIEAKEILIPFKSDVVKKGLNEFEVVAYMKNGDIKVSQTYTYNIEEGIGEGKQTGAGGSSDGHTHNNLTVLNAITQAKVNEWNNKADSTHSHSEYASKSHTHNASEIEGLENVDIDLSDYYTKSETYNKTEIDNKIANMGPAGTVDTSEFYNKEEIDRKDKILDDKITTLSDEIEILSNKIPINLQDVIDDLIGRVEILENNKPPTHIAVSSVELNKQSISCVVGDVVTLTATVLPSDATNKNITWSSSNDSVVKIDNGVVTAVSKGTSVITVTTEDGGFTVSCNVVVDVAIDGFDIRYLKTEIPSTPITFPNELHPNPAEPDLVHPCVIYVKNGWNGYKYWMGITPYTDTQSSTENPCILCSDNGEDWIIPNGVKVPIFGRPATGHNSDPYIFIDKDGETMQYINRWADGTSTLEIMSSKDGITWTDKQVMLPKSDEYDYLSPSICIYNDKYYLFATNNAVGPNNIITVLESDNLLGEWNKVNEIIIDKFTSIWHSEIKYIDGEFIGLLQTGSAQGGDLVLCKFKTPFDSTVESSTGAFLCGSGINDSWNNLYYKSSFVKTDTDIKVYANGKSRGNLDAFTQWRVGLVRCSFENEIIDFADKYELVSTYLTNDFELNRPILQGSAVSGYKTVYAPFVNNGLIEIEFEKGEKFDLIFKLLNTGDYWMIKENNNRLEVYRMNGGKKQASKAISFILNNSSNLKIEFEGNVYRLYIDDRFCTEVIEDFYTGKDYFIKRHIGFSSNDNAVQIKSMKAYCPHEDRMSLEKALEYVEHLKLENSSNNSNFLLLDDYTTKQNGVLVADQNGTQYFTKDNMPSVSNGKLICNATNSALVNISDCSKYEVTCVLTDSYNKHQVYLCLTDDVEISFGLEGQHDGYKFAKKVFGTVTEKSYNILPYSFKNGTDKVVRCVVDFNSSNVDLYIDNQWVSKLDISDVSVSNFKTGVGGDLANCGFKFIAVKRLD